MKRKITKLCFGCYVGKETEQLPSCDPYAELDDQVSAERESESDSLRVVLEEDLTPFQFKVETERAKRLRQRNVSRKMNEVPLVYTSLVFRYLF